jgi:WhiB family transcriptional regulator, redox-sensing transcriptional regulator
MSAPSQSWKVRGACAGASLSLFFGPDAETPEQRYDREAEAIAVCLQCPVRRPCGQFAVVNGIVPGVWGGFGETERALMRRRWLRRQRGYERRGAA